MFLVPGIALLTWLHIRTDRPSHLLQALAELVLPCQAWVSALAAGAEWTQALGESFLLATKAALLSTHGWSW